MTGVLWHFFVLNEFLNLWYLFLDKEKVVLGKKCDVMLYLN